VAVAGVGQAVHGKRRDGQHDGLRAGQRLQLQQLRRITRGTGAPAAGGSRRSQHARALHAVKAPDQQQLDRLARLWLRHDDTGGDRAAVRPCGDALPWRPALRHVGEQPRSGQRQLAAQRHRCGRDTGLPDGACQRWPHAPGQQTPFVIENADLLAHIGAIGHAVQALEQGHTLGVA
jgi:hypothetical protein